MSPCGAWVIAVLSAGVALGCGRKDKSAASAASSSAQASGPAADCSAHAVCNDHYFMDVVAPHCEAGKPCTLSITLAARGAFHINDEYAYKFTADLTPGVQFVGTDPAGQIFFTKAAGDWHKTDPASGVMDVKFFIGTPGILTLGGTFKFSVCSDASCVVEQKELHTKVIAM